MRAIVTVVGKDKPGIIAKVSGVLAEKSVNIEDISQTIMQGSFTMIMLCDVSNSELKIKELGVLLSELGDKIGVSIHVQNQEIFNAMHKI
jgi:ACT domain-containing protein